MTEFCNCIGRVLRIRSNTIAPCNKIKKQANIFDLEEIKQYNTWLEGLNDKEWDPACIRCYNDESKGLRSLRSFRKSEDELPGLILEIAIDNICNAACIMCGSYNSTTWEKYERNISGKECSSLEDEKKLIDLRIKNLLSLITDKKISLIRFLGGEPFESDTHIKLLNEIKKIHNSEEISLIYTTNASKIPDNTILDLWKEFSDIQIIASIDGVGEHFNYIRWPLRWHQVEENIKFYRDHEFIKFNRFNIALNPFNIYYYDRYIEWSNETFGKNLFSPIECEGIVNLSCVPNELMNVIKSKYEDMENEKSIPKLLNKFSPSKYERFMNYIKFHDHHRKLNWREVFPEVEQYFHNVD
jgi:organic radical activating enzyme